MFYLFFVSCSCTNIHNVHRLFYFILATVIRRAWVGFNELHLGQQ